MYINGCGATKKEIENKKHLKQMLIFIGTFWLGCIVAGFGLILMCM